MTNRFEEGAKHLLEFKNQNLSKLNSLPRLEKVDGVYVLSQEYKKYIESHIQVEDSNSKKSVDHAEPTEKMDSHDQVIEKEETNHEDLQNSSTVASSSIESESIQPKLLIDINSIQALPLDIHSPETSAVVKHNLDTLLSFLSSSGIDPSIVDLYKHTFSYLQSNSSSDQEDSTVSKEQYESLLAQQTLSRSTISELKGQIEQLQTQVEEDKKQLNLSESLIQQSNKEQSTVHEDLQNAYKKINDLTQQYDELYKQHLQLQEQSEELENTLKFLLENYKPFNYEEFIQHHPL